MNRDIVLIIDNVRSALNVGAMLRTAECLGVKEVVLVGITAHPEIVNDPRLPHVVKKAESQISKTALGAEKLLDIEYFPDPNKALEFLKMLDAQLIVIEQTNHSQPISQYRPSQKMAVVLGNEVEGVSPEFIAAANTQLEIPMHGKKESLNVASACAIALFQLSRN